MSVRVHFLRLGEEPDQWVMDECPAKGTTLYLPIGTVHHSSGDSPWRSTWKGEHVPFLVDDVQWRCADPVHSVWQAEVTLVPKNRPPRENQHDERLLGEGPALRWPEVLREKPQQ